MKRSRSTRSYAQLEHEATGDINVPIAAEQSVRVRSNASRRSAETISNVASQRARLTPCLLSPQWRRPLQIKFVAGDGFSVLPESYLDACNHCRRFIGQDEDRYMNGGLEAYCSAECRQEFNNNKNKMMEEAEERSVESYSSTEEDEEELSD